MEDIPETNQYCCSEANIVAVARSKDFEYYLTDEENMELVTKNQRLSLPVYYVIVITEAPHEHYLFYLTHINYFLLCSLNVASLL